MPRIPGCRLFSLVLLLVFAACADAATRPFIERIRPEDYRDVEKIFAEPFSREHDLIVLRTTDAKPFSVLTLDRTASGYTLALQVASNDEPGGWIKISEELDATLAQQVLQAFELKLHRQVGLSNFKRGMSKTGSELWVYQRLSDNRIAAAYSPMETTLDNPAAATFIDEFIGGLQQLFGLEGEERAALLQKIDRIATEIILAESS